MSSQLIETTDQGSPVMLKAPILEKESSATLVETFPSKQGNLAIAGTIQALSLVSDDVCATTEPEPDTSTATSPPSFSSTGGLIGGSALSMGSLSTMELQKSLLQISLQSIEQAVLSNQAANNYATSRYNTAYSAAQDAYAATMQQAYADMTTAITSFTSVAGSMAISSGITNRLFGGTGGYPEMVSAQKEMDAVGSNKAHLVQEHMDNPHPLPRLTSNTGHTVGNGNDLIKKANLQNDLVANKNGKISTELQEAHNLNENGYRITGRDGDGKPTLSTTKDPQFVEAERDAAPQIARQQEGYNGTGDLANPDCKIGAIKKSLEDRNGKLTDAEKTRLGITDNTDPQLAMARYQYNQEKVAAIQNSIKIHGRADTPEMARKYGEINFEDPVVRYAFRKTANEMTPEKLAEARTRLDGFSTQASNRWSSAMQSINTNTTTWREVTDMAKNSIASALKMREADFTRSASEKQALADLMMAQQSQLLSLQDTWMGLNSTYYQQAMSSPSTLADALRRANSPA